MADPTVAESRRFCARCDAPVGRGPRRGTRAQRGLLPQVRDAVLVRAEARAPGTWSAGQYEVAGCLAHGGHGLGLPGPGPQRLRPLGGAQGPAQRGRQRRHGGGAGRAALPGRGRASERGQDLQLRRARGLRLHRHGVRRRDEPQADPRRPPRGQRRRAGPAARSPRRSPTCWRSCPALGYLHRTGPAVLRLQARQRDPDRSTR